MTYNDGCLGSRNDEERSEMRYVMWIAEFVNHQNFERTLYFSFLGKYSCLSVFYLYLKLLIFKSFSLWMFIPKNCKKFFGHLKN